MQILIQDNTYCVCRVGGIKGAPESAATCAFLKFIGLGILIGLTVIKCKLRHVACCKTDMSASFHQTFIIVLYVKFNRLCGLMVRVPGYRPRGPRSNLGATRFSEK
jgi:hypothetical protein